MNIPTRGEFKMASTSAAGTKRVLTIRRYSKRGNPARRYLHSGRWVDIEKEETIKQDK